MIKLRTRFAPSPTGFLHIGSLRTALYAYALAKHSGGDFVLRIEDTDQKRKVEGAVEALKEILKKFNLNWDEFYVQSERQKDGIYFKAAKELVGAGVAFYCNCQSKNAKEEGYSTELRDPCRDKGYTEGAIKLKVPEGKELKYFDFVHKKEISWNSNDVYDATLLKSDGFPTYHLAVVVDDLDMKVSHVLRGHDWLPSTPIHLLVFDYLGKGKRPEIGHTTDILSSTTGKKLSKRRDSVFVEQFLKEGYLPDALLNFIMLLGWAPKDNREIFTLNEFVENFDINGFQEANPKFLYEKLDWMNGQYIRSLSDKDLVKLLTPFASDKSNEDVIKKSAPMVKDRIKKLSDYTEFSRFLFETPKVDPDLLGPKSEDHLTSALNIVNECKNWTIEKLNEAFSQEIQKSGFKTGDYFMDLRIAITGSKFTPPINDSMILLGKDEVIKRLKSLIDK